MTMEEALGIFKAEYPKKEVNGYWIAKEGIIFNTKTYQGYRGLAQFVVTPHGEVYGTNPLRSDLDIIKMTRI